MKSDPRPLGAWLTDATSPVSQLLQVADHLRSFERAVRTFVGPPLALDVRVAEFREGRLVLHVPSAAGATALRYRRNELLAHLQKEHGFAGNQIDVRVNPDSRKP